MSFFDSKVEGHERTKDLWKVTNRKISETISKHPLNLRLRILVIDIHYFGGELRDLEMNSSMEFKKQAWRRAKNGYTDKKSDEPITKTDLIIFSRYAALLAAGKNISDEKLNKISHNIMLHFFFIKESYLKPGLFKNWENSCYLDSLLMLFLTTTPSYYRDVIFNTDVDRIKYTLKSNGTTLACDGAGIYPDETKDIAKKLQEQLLSDYKALIKPQRKSMKCTDIRRILRSCEPSLFSETRNIYTMTSASDIYQLFTELFPNLIIRNVKRINRSPEPVSSFVATDFMERDGNPPFIDWDRLNQPVIVFRNTLALNIDNFNSPIPQELEGGFKFEKYRVFDELILNGKYELFGVIIHKGSKLSGHYTACIKSSFNDVPSWYFYNDMAPSWKKLKELPESVWKSSSASRPELFFYMKV